MYKYSNRSLEHLKTCHQSLQTIFLETIKEFDCSIVCGHRGEKKQNEAYQNGYSKLQFPKSKHNTLPSLAVDVIPYPTGYNSIPKFKELAQIVKRIAKANNITITHGGDWRWKDWPHYEVRGDK